MSYSDEKDEVAKMWFQLYSATLRDIRHTCHEKVDSVVSFVGGGESVDRQKWFLIEVISVQLTH